MRRGVVVGLVIAAVAIVVGGGAVWWILSRPSGPETTASAYLEALAAGDGPRALSYVEAPEGDDVLPSAYEGADEYVSDPVVDQVSETNGGATADVRFRLDGRERSATLPLVQRDGRWLVGAAGLGTVTATTTIGDHVRVGAATIPAGEEVALLPAVYPVSAAPAGLLDGSARVLVLPGAQGDAAVDASVSSEATRLAQKQLDGYASECTQPASSVPEHCGLRVPWAADLATLTSIAFRVEQTPQVALSPDLRTFAATGGIVVATATGTTRAGETASFTYRADDWTLRGTVELTSDGMQLAVG
ncbi:hypothetical protein AAIB33_08915 [Microbacterium sp. AZCO]|uniref:hypothetical protein n=1 Tax=Microbacterium sp. AZCO TaxID=3142976 RepID=UPI0031F3430B